MARKRVSFVATKVKKVPVRVNFRTWDGQRVSFRATKAIRVPKRVSFFARSKKTSGVLLKSGVSKKEGDFLAITDID